MATIRVRRLSAVIVAAAISASSFAPGQATETGDKPAVKSSSKHHHKAAPARGRIITPESSKEKPGDIGKRAHTNYLILDTHGPLVPKTVRRPAAQGATKQDGNSTAPKP